jgi:hypothetical protein
LRGTPSLVLLDRQGRVRLQHFGSIDDLALGATIGRLLAENDVPAAHAAASDDTARDECDALSCPAPRPR